MPSRRPWCKKPVFSTVFSIGIYTGPSPLALGPPAGLENPVLTRESVTDRYASFVADPFMIRVDGTWHMFFEVLACGALSKKGEIGLATSRDGLRWAYQRIVLAEPFHLSYPHVFAWEGEHYLIPESTAAGGVRLYRADPFPTRWTLAAVLLEGPVLLDSSVFHRDGRWWMFTETDAARGTLRLFHARELTGPWREHPRSPVVAADPRTARPAGRVLATPDRLVRFAQDCELDYGVAVRALEITRLTEREYEEREVAGGPLLAGGGEGWRALGMHHLDVHPREEGGFIACVDGWRERARRPRELAVWAADHGRQALELTRAARSRRPR
ncbi:glucosamine inositolphosphorylceramide transferase family protein [Anaeromyxobacter diazotrophicus]|uniref:Glucosamine inositolphosphorylceramide transferase 1 N-terminal domain-containing protein n=1 Tax=Anaeromyxobacter diazotrophicus TaxID=2590199 RepID=A0A7I9VN42_9BACT|nr:hypothetical protein [Anaeromyxobacter diazotrophicus]GEJ57628.1 hypothetical protein AMYX_23690 [Anaeromyxobacter diazotrophicus]